MACHIQGVYIADGFADDCDELMHKCLRIETLTFEAFTEIWKDMKLGYLFHGRSSGAEIAELSEEVIHIAKHYMVADTSNFEESVAGLFLVYALLNLQPFAGFACLRIVQEDVPAINRIEMVARRDRRHDVLYILGSVLIKGPVQYQAALRERGMECPIRKYLEGYTTIDKLGIRPKGVFYRQNEELDIINEINNLALRYTNCKAQLIGPGKKDRNLDYVKANIGTELGTSLKNIITGVVEDNEAAASQSDESDVDAIKNLKEKAMKAKVNPIRHRVGVCTRIQKSSSPPEVKSPPRKARKVSASASKVKEVPCQIEPKAKRLPRGRRRKNRFSLDTEDEKSSKDSDDLVSSEEPEGSQESDGDNLDLSKFDKANVTEAAEEHEIVNRIEIESLPTFIRTEDGGKTYEIEIIDKLGASGLQDAKNNIDKEEEKPSTSQCKKSNDILKRAEKRDLKKTLVKSRFKRMGMLPVANFQAK